jgi:subtilisin family serine protease
MIVSFDNERQTKTFSATASQVVPFAGRTIALANIRNAQVKQKILAEKSVKNRTYVRTFPNSDTPFYLTGDMVMQPKKDVSAQEILTKFKIDGEIITQTGTGIVLVRMNNWDSIFAMANSIYESGLVDWCHPDFITPIQKTTTDPLFSQQYYLKNTGQNGGTAGVDIKVEDAWRLSTGSNIRVAVIDDGVEEHEDLAGRVLQGYTPLNPTGYGQPIQSGHHGQACAGIIAASHNTLGIAGIAPSVQIIPINIFYSNESTQDLASAIEYAWNPTKGKADVISNSWSFSDPFAYADNIAQEISNAISQGRGNRGSIVVFSSGNYSDLVAFPANLDAVLSVGAVNKNGIRWDYSCYGSRLDVMAPSGNNGRGQGDVVTTDRMGNNGYEGSDKYCMSFGGTSAAAPQVAGIAALMLSVNPNLTQKQVVDIIEQTAQKVNPATYNYATTSGRPNGIWNNQMGYGLVDAYTAVSKALNTLTPVISANKTKVYDGEEVTVSVNNPKPGVIYEWENMHIPVSGVSGPTYTFNAYALLPMSSPSITPNGFPGQPIIRTQIKCRARSGNSVSEWSNVVTVLVQMLEPLF